MERNELNVGECVNVTETDFVIDLIRVTVEDSDRCCDSVSDFVRDVDNDDSDDALSDKVSETLFDLVSLTFDDKDAVSVSDFDFGFELE